MNRNSIFGWSYPAGCSGPPDYDEPISELEEGVLVLLEDADMPSETSDKIMKIINEWQREKERKCEAGDDYYEPEAPAEETTP